MNRPSLLRQRLHDLHARVTRLLVCFAGGSELDLIVVSAPVDLYRLHGAHWDSYEIDESARHVAPGTGLQAELERILLERTS